MMMKMNATAIALLVLMMLFSVDDGRRFVAADEYGKCTLWCLQNFRQIIDANVIPVFCDRLCMARTQGIGNEDAIYAEI
ncbi:unnamed protein product [Linum trigynum]|uniref:Uncharacterized protein n=1 Tax=Linum trigynum TaxID=586398 RepID=A0AAV2FKK2_9ROSI